MSFGLKYQISGQEAWIATTDRFHGAIRLSLSVPGLLLMSESIRYSLADEVRDQ